MGDMTALGAGLMMLGIVFAVGLVVLAQFQISVAPDQNTILTNSTPINTTTVVTQLDHLLQYAEHEYGAFLNGSVTTTVKNNATDPLNYTVTVNGNAIGLANGYNETGILAVTLSQLTNGLNNVSYLLTNSTTITETTLSLTWEKSSDVDAKNVVGDVLGVYDDAVGWLPIIVIVLVVAIVLGLLGLGFGRR